MNDEPHNSCSCRFVVIKCVTVRAKNRCLIGTTKTSNSRDVFLCFLTTIKHPTGRCAETSQLRWLIVYVSEAPIIIPFNLPVSHL
jgi:hypothetical protein